MRRWDMQLGSRTRLASTLGPCLGAETGRDSPMREKEKEALVDAAEVASTKNSRLEDGKEFEKQIGRQWNPTPTSIIPLDPAVKMRYLDCIPVVSRSLSVFTTALKLL